MEVQNLFIIFCCVRGLIIQIRTNPLLLFNNEMERDRERKKIIIINILCEMKRKKKRAKSKKSPITLIEH